MRKQVGRPITRENKKVAVVIPYFNGSRYVEKALESVTNQIRPPSEVIVVDDGSDREEAELLVALSERFNFRYLRTENGGQSKARNIAVANCESDFICFLDQDDYFLPNHISDLVDAWDESDPNLAYVYGDLWRATEEGVVISHSCIKSEAEHPHKDLRTMIRTNMFVLPSATLISKEAFQAIGGFDDQFRGYEDDDLFMRFFCEGYSQIYLDEPVTVWTLNTVSTSFSESMARSRFLYYKKLLNTFPPSSIPFTNVFGDLLVPRFAFQFAADVISAAFNGGENFHERQRRLKEFRDTFRKSNEIERKFRKKFLLVTLPLASLSFKKLKKVLTVGLILSPILEKTGLPGVGLFITRFKNLGANRNIYPQASHGSSETVKFQAPPENPHAD